MILPGPHAHSSSVLLTAWNGDQAQKLLSALWLSLQEARQGGFHKTHQNLRALPESAVHHLGVSPMLGSVSGPRA